MPGRIGARIKDWKKQKPQTRFCLDVKMLDGCFFFPFFDKVNGRDNLGWFLFTWVDVTLGETRILLFICSIEMSERVLGAFLALQWKYTTSCYGKTPSAPHLIPWLATPSLSSQQQWWLTPCPLVWLPQMDNRPDAAKLRLKASLLFVVQRSRKCAWCCPCSQTSLSHCHHGIIFLIGNATDQCGGEKSDLLVWVTPQWLWTANLFYSCMLTLRVNSLSRHI